MSKIKKYSSKDALIMLETEEGLYESLVEMIKLQGSIGFPINSDIGKDKSIIVDYLQHNLNTGFIYSRETA